MLNKISKLVICILFTTCITPVSANSERQNKVIIFTQAFCPACIHAKQYMEEQNIDYIELDIETNPKALEVFKQINGRGTPLFVINKKMAYGFDPAFIEANLYK
ncbi:glutaredoxin family protein [Litoribrevibacter euphylliae]|uniref:Glutaredoxin family protein n=1 Tax=Litoribrevibacter euphylliae TaxID=1834034 RepID=A0ABV7HLJ2_9GAMM